MPKAKAKKCNPSNAESNHTYFKQGFVIYIIIENRNVNRKIEHRYYYIPGDKSIREKMDQFSDNKM